MKQTKAYRAIVEGFPDCIIAGLSASNARYVVYTAARDAGYDVKFMDIRVLREADCDEWIRTEGKPGFCYHVGAPHRTANAK